MTELIIKKCPYCNGTGEQYYLEQNGKLERINRIQKDR